MKTPRFRAELRNGADVIDILEFSTLTQLAAQINKVFLPNIQPGDTIKIIDNRE